MALTVFQPLMAGFRPSRHAPRYNGLIKLQPQELNVTLSLKILFTMKSVYSLKVGKKVFLIFAPFPQLCYQ